MSVKKGIDYTSDEIIEGIYDYAMNVYCHGIAVPSDVHPCGWGWLDFEGIIDENEILEYKFSLSDISNGIYEEHDYEFLTLKEILIKTEGRFLFELNTWINWEE